MNIGSVNIDDFKLGNNQVDKIMLGSGEVWSNNIPATMTRTDSFETSNSLSTFNVTMYFGADDPNRKIIVVAMPYLNSWQSIAPSSCTVGGQAATMVTTTTYSVRCPVTVFSIDYPTGDVGYVNMPLPNAASGMKVTIYRVIGGTIHDSNEESQAYVTNSISTNINYPKDGCVLAVASNNNSAGVTAWGGVTYDYGTSSVGESIMIFAKNQTITQNESLKQVSATFTTTAEYRNIVAVSWNPL